MPFTTLHWNFPSEEPPKRRCLVRTDHPTHSLVVANYIKPSEREPLLAFWQNLAGEKIESKVLMWASLFETEYALDILFPDCIETQESSLMRTSLERL